MTPDRQPQRDEFTHAIGLVDDVIYAREENGDELTYESIHTELETLLTIHERQEKR